MPIVLFFVGVGWGILIEDSEFYFIVVNGHNLITGWLKGRRTWPHVELVGWLIIIPHCTHPRAVKCVPEAGSVVFVGTSLACCLTQAWPGWIQAGPLSAIRVLGYRRPTHC